MCVCVCGLVLFAVFCVLLCKYGCRALVGGGALRKNLVRVAHTMWCLSWLELVVVGVCVMNTNHPGLACVDGAFLVWRFWFGIFIQLAVHNWSVLKGPHSCNLACVSPFPGGFKVSCLKVP